jgi:hypothetical protein
MNGADLLIGGKTTLTSNAGCPQDLERRSPTRAEDARWQAEPISCLNIGLPRLIYAREVLPVIPVLHPPSNGFITSTCPA